MKIGFTGTRRAVLSFDQKEALAEYLSSHRVTEFHHGDCVGSDSSAHDLVKAQFFNVTIVVHPPKDEKYRAFCDGHRVLPSRDYIARNHDIVDACDVLVAAPAKKENPRSGTLATIRYAKSAGKPVILL